MRINCDCIDENPNETLGELKTRMLIRLGGGAMTASPPPGMPELITDFLQSSQRLLYRQYKVLRTGRFFTWDLVQGERFYDLPDNAEALTLATPAAPGLVASGVGGTLPAGTYGYVITAVNANGETEPSIGTSVVTAGATSTVTIVFPTVLPVQGVSEQTAWRVYGRSGGGTEQLLAEVPVASANYVDTGGAIQDVNPPVINTTYECLKRIDPRMIEWVGISDSGEWWQPIACGIPPEFYSWNQVQGWPQRYEIRQCIELWPAPDVGPWKLRIKGDFGLEAFSDDADKATIDSEAVFLHALARAKAHYQQPDASNCNTDAVTYIKNLVAGAHNTRRYIPGQGVAPNPVPPRWLPLENMPP